MTEPIPTRPTHLAALTTDDREPDDHPDTVERDLPDSPFALDDTDDA